MFLKFTLPVVLQESFQRPLISHSFITDKSCNMIQPKSFNINGGLLLYNRKECNNRWIWQALLAGNMDLTAHHPILCGRTRDIKKKDLSSGVSCTICGWDSSQFSLQVWIFQQFRYLLTHFACFWFVCLFSSFRTIVS